MTPPSAPHHQQSIELHIEELILDGFPTQDGYWIKRAVEQELARLFAEQRVPPSLAQGGDVANLDGGSFEVAPNATAEGIGVQLAQALYGGLDG